MLFVGFQWHEEALLAHMAKAPAATATCTKHRRRAGP